MKTTPTEIKLGSARYSVGIESSKTWTSEDGSIVREYLTIGKPGISPVASAFLIVSGQTQVRSRDITVNTDHGMVVWQPTAGGLTGAKKDAVNAWFISNLKK